MSIDFSDKAAAKKGTTTSTKSSGAGAGGGGGGSVGLYESRSLLCKNKCGYYGNSMQYDGYCSICYRRMKQARLQHQYSQQQQQLPASSSSSYSLSASSQHSSFDDSTSLLTSSQSFNKSLFSLDEKNRNQIWNEQVNLSKFATKKKQQQDSRRSSTFKLFRRPSSTLAAAVDTVTKVADKAVNIVDQSSSGSLSVTQHLPSFNQLANNYIMNAVMSDPNFVEFNNSLNRLVASPTSSTTTSSSSLLQPPGAKKADLLDESSTTSSAITEFEEQFRIYFPQLHQDLYKKMKSFVDRFLEALKRKDSAFNGNKQYEIVQDFYKTIYRYILTSASLRAYLEKTASLNKNNDDSASFDSSYSSSNASTVNAFAQNIDETEKLHEAIMIMVESYVTKSIYDHVFPLLMTEFEEQDMNLQKRIRSFHWVTNEMIGTCLDENSIFYRDSYEEALNYIVEMDSKHTAHEKMICITECSKNIYKAINISASIKNNINDVQSLPASPTNELSADISIVNTILTTNDETNSLININSPPAHDEAGAAMSSPKNSKSFATADDYLPAFIYIVLRANPTMLYSNMNFISRFAYEKRILQGEHAYHFCSLNAIITHIENLNAQHLNMSEEEFESYCNGLNETNGIANIFKIIQANMKILSELKDKQKLLKQEAYKLQSDMNTFRSTMQTNFNQCLIRNKPKYTNNIDGFERPVAKNFMDDLDADLSALNATALAQPIMPVSNTTTNTTTTDEAGATGTTGSSSTHEQTQAGAAAAMDTIEPPPN